MSDPGPEIGAAEFARDEALFTAALGLEPAARREFLRRECGDDSAAFTRIVRLLDAEAESERFFAESGAALTFTDLQTENTAELRTMVEAEGKGEEPIGTRIGRYKLLRKIGEGGWGGVYLAQQEDPVRRLVALKIIKLGMETRSVIARFEAERQALAMMDHPNIARVFDAGATEGGAPYFVMELVRGVRITDYCDRNRLPVRERLELFIQVCHAIQHAHQKGIIHGDVKPSNIMVTMHDGQPLPKVIDFGVAKATEGQLTEKLQNPGYAQPIGTPAYMSPEQLAVVSRSVDTRSDVYSLGVLLHELLTGKTPFDGQRLLEAGLAEMRRMLESEVVVRPSDRLASLEPADAARIGAGRRSTLSKLASLLRGDLDCIVLKALARDRDLRYVTANGLAEDIQRHLHDEPVVAYPPRRAYRFRKLVRRNRVVFAAGGAVAAALVIGMGASTWMFFREREARQRAVAAEQQQGRLRHDAEIRQKITQAALLVSQERLEEADRQLDEVSLTQPTVEGAAVFRFVGEWHVLHGRWARAADRFGVLVRVNQLDGWDVSSLDFLRHGPALVELGDRERYGRFREDAIARIANTACPFSDRILKVSLLLPANPAILSSLGPLAEDTAKSFREAEAAGDGFQAAWRAVSLALWEYRRGDFAQAAVWAQRCLAYPEANAPRTTTARVIWVLAQQRLGRGEETRVDLREVRELFDNKFKAGMDLGSPVKGFWFDWSFAKILLDEAEARPHP